MNYYKESNKHCEMYYIVFDFYFFFYSSNSFPFTQIPTLEETIKTCLDLNIKMFIEVKAYKDSVKV